MSNTIHGWLCVPTTTPPPPTGGGGGGGGGDGTIIPTPDPTPLIKTSSLTVTVNYYLGQTKTALKDTKVTYTDNEANRTKVQNTATNGQTTFSLGTTTTSSYSLKAEKTNCTPFTQNYTGQPSGKYIEIILNCNIGKAVVAIDIEPTADTLEPYQVLSKDAVLSEATISPNIKNPVVLNIKRFGNLSASQTTNLTLSGSAKLGTDYTITGVSKLNFTKIFKPNENKILLFVVPKSLKAGTDIILTVKAGSGYDVGTSNKAMIKIEGEGKTQSKLVVRVQSSLDHDYQLKDADVTIKGVDWRNEGITNSVGYYSVFVDQGEYKITVQKNDFKKSSKKIDITDTKKTNYVDIYLVPEKTNGVGAARIMAIFEDIPESADYYAKVVLSGKNLESKEITISNHSSYWIDLPIGGYSIKSLPTEKYSSIDLPKYFEVSPGKISQVKVHFRLEENALYLKTIVEGGRLLKARYSIIDNDTGAEVYKSVSFSYGIVVPTKILYSTNIKIISYPEIDGESQPPNPELTKDVVLDLKEKLLSIIFVYDENHQNCISMIDSLPLEFPFCAYGEKARDILKFSDTVDKSEILAIYSRLIKLRQKYGIDTIPTKYIISDDEGDNASADTEGGYIEHGTQEFINKKNEPPMNTDIAVHEFGHLHDSPYNGSSGDWLTRTWKEWNIYYLKTKGISRTIIRDCVYSIPLHTCDGTNVGGHPWDNVEEYFASNFMVYNQYLGEYNRKIDNIASSSIRKTMLEVIKLLDAL